MMAMDDLLLYFNLHEEKENLARKSLKTLRTTHTM